RHLPVFLRARFGVIPRFTLLLDDLVFPGSSSRVLAPAWLYQVVPCIIADRTWSCRKPDRLHGEELRQARPPATANQLWLWMPARNCLLRLSGLSEPRSQSHRAVILKAWCFTFLDVV